MAAKRNLVWAAVLALGAAQAQAQAQAPTPTGATIVSHGIGTFDALRLPADFPHLPYVNPDAPKGYAERFIHSELYKKYKGVNSVVHAHNEAVLPFSISSVPLRPVFHMGGVMGE